MYVFFLQPCHQRWIFYVCIEPGNGKIQIDFAGRQREMQIAQGLSEVKKAQTGTLIDCEPKIEGCGAEMVPGPQLSVFVFWGHM